MGALQSLNLKHFQIAHLLAQGKSQAEIARKLAISTATIQNCLQTPEFNEVLDTLRFEYAEKLQETAILPFAEMQKKINEHSLGALGRVVELSNMADKDSVKLKANLAILDRASNVPKSANLDSPDAQRELFSANIVQLVLQTALQVGDNTVLKAAERALKQIPTNSVESDTIDVEFSDNQAESNTPINPFAMKSIDEVLQTVPEGEME